MKKSLMTLSLLLFSPMMTHASNPWHQDDEQKPISSFEVPIIKPEPQNDDYSRSIGNINNTNYHDVHQTSGHKRTSDEMLATDPSHMASTLKLEFKQPLPKRPKVQQASSVGQTPQHTASRSTQFNFKHPASLTNNAMDQLNVNAPSGRRLEDMITIKDEDMVNDHRSSILPQENDDDATQSHYTTTQPKVEEDERIEFNTKDSVTVKFNGKDLVINRYHPVGQPYLWDGHKKQYVHELDNIKEKFEIRFIVASEYSHFRNGSEFQRKRLRQEIHSRPQFSRLKYDNFTKYYFTAIRHLGTQEERDYFSGFFMTSHVEKNFEKNYEWIGTENEPSTSNSKCKAGLEIRDIILTMLGGQTLPKSQQDFDPKINQIIKGAIKNLPQYRDLNDSSFNNYYSIAYKVRYKSSQ